MDEEQIRNNEQELIWQHFLDELLLDDKEFKVFTEGQWRRLKKILYPLTHPIIRDFIPKA